MDHDKLTLRDEIEIISVAHWKVFKHLLARAIGGCFFVCILATCIGLYYGGEAMSDVGTLWLIELYLSLFAIGLFLFKRFVFDRYIRKRKS